MRVDQPTMPVTASVAGITDFGGAGGGWARVPPGGGRNGPRRRCAGGGAVCWIGARVRRRSPAAVKLAELAHNPYKSLSPLASGRPDR
ncbi:hypothetical protein [Streptomyces flavofungini]|uniref:hypothetical protein n=1 Tax=Streptomyces flavofungini TaxID=68200 RepID=UPI0034DEA4E2